MKTKSDMKPFIIAALSLTLLVGCGNDDFPAEEPTPQPHTAFW